MGSYIKRLFSIKTTLPLCVLSIFCLVLSVARIQLTQTFFLFFLVWNLVLAFIPWLITISLYTARPKHSAITILWLVLWLLFFPNAPYLVTDFVHLGRFNTGYFWLDLFILTMYSFTGLFYGFLSLKFVEKILIRNFNIKRPSLFSLFILYLCGFGMYIGRFLRWNSWDALVFPYHLLKDMSKHIVNPTIWIFTLCSGTGLFLLYWLLFACGDDQ